MILTGYVLAPVGIYLMWRYQAWPVRVKAGFTVFGLTMWVVATYVSTAYITPRLPVV